MAVTRVLITGGGLAGSLAALALAKRRPEIELLLLEQGDRFGGQHVWSFFDSDAPAEAAWLLDLVGRRRWPDHEVRFPTRQRILRMGYNSIRSSDLDAAVRSSLPSARWRTGARIVEVKPTSVLLDDGERIEADCVIDARGAAAAGSLELGWQKFVGVHYQSASPHGVTRPMIMDATIDQLDGYRFVYLLPFSPTELLIEDTYYSDSPVLDREAVKTRVGQVAEQLAGSRLHKVSEEEGVLPVLIAGELEALWPAADLVPRLGMRGGFFHPTTGYSLPDALANASLLASSVDLSSPVVASLLRRRAKRLWSERHFFQLLNRMLFRGAAPDQRYRILEHFYRLPEPVVARFYAGQLTRLDKLRILSGRPPIPVIRALRSLRKRAA